MCCEVIFGLKINMEKSELIPVRRVYGSACFCIWLSGGKASLYASGPSVEHPIEIGSSMERGGEIDFRKDWPCGVALAVKRGEAHSN